MNGCGPEKMPEWLKTILFNWMFLSACNRHDKCYLEGGSVWKRIKCDLKFLAFMYLDILKAFYVIVVGLIVAPFMFLAVLFGGWYFFGEKD